MHDARARLSAMVDGLRAHPRVELLTAEFGDPAGAAALAAATRSGGGRLPAGVAEFYASVGSFSLEWRLDEKGDDDLEVYGLSEILPVDEVFGDWEGVTWFPDGDQSFRSVLPVDMWVPEACAAFLQPPGEPVGDTIAYHYFGEELHDTGYTFDEYLERLIVSRGYWYWLQTLHPEGYRGEEAETFRRAMPELFGDYDDELFQPRP